MPSGVATPAGAALPLSGSQASSGLDRADLRILLAQRAAVREGVDAAVANHVARDLQLLAQGAACEHAEHARAARAPLGRNIHAAERSLVV